MSRPEVNESLKQDFIKVILTKNQERSKRNKKKVRIRKSRCIESDQTHCCTEKFNMSSSLCRALKVTLYFSEGFLKAAPKAPWPLGVTMVYFLEQEFTLWSFTQ